MDLNERVKNTKRNIRMAMVSKIVRLIVNFILRTIIIKTMGALYLGLDTLFSSVLQILSLAELGVGTAIVFSMYEPMANGDDRQLSALLALYRKLYRRIGLAVVVFGLAVLPFLPMVIHSEIPGGLNLYVLYLLNLVNCAVSYFMFAYTGSLLQASQRRDLLSTIETVINVLTGVSRIAVLLIFRNYYAYTVILPLMTIASNLLTWIVTRQLFPRVRAEGTLPKEQVSDISKRVAGSFIFKLSGTCRNSFDSLVLSGFLGLTALAKYNNYYYIINCIINFVTLVPNSMTSGIGHSMVKESVDKNYRDMLKFTMLYNWIVTICASCLYCLYQPFIIWWIGEDWLFPKVDMAIFCLYFFCLTANGIIQQYRQAAGLWWKDKFRYIVEAILNLVLDVVLVRYTGVTGVLLASVCTLVFINTFMGTTVVFREYFGRKRQLPFLARLVFDGAVAAVCCFAADFFCSYVPLEGIPGIMVRAVIAVIVPMPVLLIASRPFSEFGDAMWFVKKRLLRR